jgi:hypothetical protein
MLTLSCTQLRSKAGKPIEPLVRASPFEREVLADDPAEITESF